MMASFVLGAEKIAQFDIRNIPRTGEKVRIGTKTYKVIDSVQILFGRNDDHAMELAIEEVK
jgi:hypothetical protein